MQEKYSQLFCLRYLHERGMAKKRRLLIVELFAHGGNLYFARAKPKFTSAAAR